MIKSLFFTLAALLLLCGFSSAFQTPRAPVASIAGVVSSTSTTALNVFGSKKKKSAAEIEAESKYWQGEWVCKDCGYIYNRVRLLAFSRFIVG